MCFRIAGDVEYETRVARVDPHYNKWVQRVFVLFFDFDYIYNF